MQDFRTRKLEVLTESDNSLVSKIRDGDKFAIKELFRRYYNSLCRFATRFVHSDEDVEDIVESVFEKIWTNREKLDSTQRIRSYLFKLTQNQALDFLKARGNRHIALSKWIDSEESKKLRVISCSDPAQEMIDNEVRAAVAEAIERLPQRCKLVFTLNRQEGLSYSEIADVLDISERTVANQIVRALKQLRKDLRSLIR
jgi:RNA polymerase sigma-70 factor (family 1)